MIQIIFIDKIKFVGNNWFRRFSQVPRGKRAPWRTTMAIVQFPAQSVETLAQIAIERLINDIVTGALKPDTKLRIEELKERYDMGASPLREALVRLASLGFVTNSTRRGFRVAPMSRADLEDITAVRQTIEAEALRRAMVSGNDDWEVGIVAALAKLDRAFQRYHEQTGKINEARYGEFEAAHKQLHVALIAGCGSPRLMQLQDVYYDQAQRYRVLAIGRAQSIDDFVIMHRALADLVLGRKGETAVTALSDHIAITLRAVYPETAGERNATPEWQRKTPNE
jgi:DNA-binding GntR family transcriptional regulator